MKVLKKLLVISPLALSFSIGFYANAEDTRPHVKPMEAASEKYGVKIKSIFASQCSWCHSQYGMKGGKGPKLAGTQLTLEETINRIAMGKSGAMPGFLKALGEKKVEAMANYIKMLPPE